MKKYLYSILIAAVIIYSSCKKSFLDSSVPGNVLPAEEYVVDLRTSQEYLNGIYTFVSSNLYFGTNVIYPELVADNIKTVSGGSNLANHYNWKQQSDEIVPTGGGSPNNMNGLYYSGYKVASSCNFLLNKAGMLKNENESKANDLLGQVYVLRGLAHLNIINAFAQAYGFTSNGQHLGVPYLKSNEWKVVDGKRITVAEVYDNILSDFRQGIYLMTDKRTPHYIINKYTAMALVARACLAKEDYNAAKNFAREVIAKYPLMELNYPDSLFTHNDKEALLQLVPSEKGGYTTTFASYYFRSVVSFLATQDIVTILQENQQDLRKKWITKNGNNWNITKYPVGVIEGFTAPGKAYLHDVIRSSEMYLIAAEAYAQNLGGQNLDSARYFLNAIRKRANIGTVPTNISDNNLVDSIYKERRRELAFEGYRMYDLLRWRKGVNRLDALTSASKELPYPSSFAIAPIPGTDVKIGGTQQNEGY